MGDLQKPFIDLISGIQSHPSLTVLIWSKQSDKAIIEKKEIEEYLRNLIRRSPSQIVTSGYTIGNLVKNPDNIFVILIKNSEIQLVINFNPDRHRYIFCSHATTEIQEWLKNFLIQVKKGFVLSAGNELPDFIGNHLEHQSSLENRVYLLNKVTFSNLVNEEVFPTSIYLLDGSEQEYEEVMKDVKTFYGYGNLDMGALFRRSPHVVLYYHASVASKLVAVARCNEFSPEIAIIGGVRTRTGFRGRGYGYAVCFKLVNYLVGKCDQIALETDVENFPAVKIYKRLGFEEIGSSMYFDNNVGIMEDVVGDRDY